MKVQIVCRGGVDEGLGHLFRARTFARAALKEHEVRLIPIIDEPLEILFYDLKCEKRYVRYDNDIIGFIRDFNPDIVLFDLTGIDTEIIRVIRRFSSLVASLSPVFNNAEQLDILFTRSSRFKALPETKIYGSLQYSIFNEHVSVIDDIVYERNLSNSQLPVAISMGGADAVNKTLTVLKALVRLKPSFSFWVLLGEGYEHSLDELVKVTKSNPIHEVVLAKTSRSMWNVMSNCSVGIFPGGLTTIEAVYAGLPSINLFESKGHLDATGKELFELGACINGGFFSDGSLSQLVSSLTELHLDRSQLMEIRRRTKGLVDLHGCERVLEKLEYHFKQKASNQC